MAILISAQEANAYQCEHNFYRNLANILIYVRYSLYALFK